MEKKDFMLCDKIVEKDLKNLKGDWKANIKFDGERIVAVKKDGEVFLINRRGNIKNNNYTEVVESLKTFEGDFVLDGEVITTDDNFNRLQQRALTKNPMKQEQLRNKMPICYMVFDVLGLYGEDLKWLKLKDRITYFSAFEKSENINFAEYEDINVCLERCKLEEREGIVLKNMDSSYQHRRSKDWLKLKFFKETNLKVVRYTENPAGIRVEDKELNAVQISGEQHKIVKQKIDSEGYCEISIQYLTQNEETKRYRFPSYRGLKNA